MFFQVIATILLLVLAPLSYAEDAASSAKTTVDKLNVVMIEVMKSAKQLGYEGRYKKFEPIVKETHDFDAIAQLALGAHWKNLDDKQKQAFINKLTDLSVATYAAQFNGYSGEEFKYESSQSLKSNRLALRYVLSAPKEKPVNFEYFLTQREGHWNIINIVVDGISDIALKKAQYTSIIDREGFDSLMNKLTQRIVDYASNDAS
ncbi:ABC transporter substrate-binding protein [Methylococcus sp. EFPC2]|uniref:ABC transporter substrate-binding protein n=1 Tax=Methylococcus sp. EFPC2 TaxID=2812648 RepID=UPI00196891E6|nr:ABC transporter substrate-binding protein [Methylococcus sp. EFPC2]QSA98889.1 ABC transporter substrate-binding protein [Methylococcus sp. EFPC2]